MIAWFDGAAGASGDMLLGALVGAGVPLEVLQQSLDRLDLGIELRVESVERASLVATRVHVEVPEARTLRHLLEIFELLSRLDVDVERLAGSIFGRLAAAEAAVHGCHIDDVHFHEVGALDSIADVVGAATGVLHLDLDQIEASTLSLGSGHARGAHGPLPVPVPAVLALTAGVAPVQAGPAAFESTTPTGAAVLVEIVDSWGPMPPMVTTAVGLGAGARDSEAVCNALRLVLGRASG